VFFSDEHFLVGRTLIKAFASMTFKPRTRAPTGTGERQRGATVERDDFHP
jgi:hypothetical protein